jgi:DMSO/TMAO reductase YedYZ heme-binding membrane subunit
MEGHKPFSGRDYFVALFVSVILLVLFSCYLLIRRGYYFDAPPTADMLFVPNKAFAGVGIALLAFTFLVGPVSRYFDRFDYWVGLRKELGIVGAFYILVHAVVSYFLLPKKFPQGWYDFSSAEFAAGLVGLFVLAALFAISFQKMIALIGPARWWFLQRWGLRIVMLLAVIHVFDMKWAGWVKWLTKGGGAPTAELANPWMPGLGILVSTFVAWVVIVRLYETLFIFKNAGFASKEISTDPVLKAHGRRFFLGSLVFLAIGYSILALRWVW